MENWLWLEWYGKWLEYWGMWRGNKHMNQHEQICISLDQRPLSCLGLKHDHLREYKNKQVRSLNEVRVSWQAKQDETLMLWYKPIIRPCLWSNDQIQWSCMRWFDVCKWIKQKEKGRGLFWVWFYLITSWKWFNICIPLGTQKPFAWIHTSYCILSYQIRKNHCCLAFVQNLLLSSWLPDIRTKPTIIRNYSWVSWSRTMLLWGRIWPLWRPK